MNDVLPPSHESEHNVVTFRPLDSTERFRPYVSFLAEQGIDAKTIKPILLERLALLDRETKTVSDEQQAIKYGRRIAESMNERGSAHALSPERLRLVELATAFTDIGKTGPREATREQSLTITRIFGVDAPFKMTDSIGQFVDMFFPSEAEHMKSTLASMGITSTETFRAFINRHAGWTFEIVKDSGLPTDVALSAASHHVLERVNPEDIIDPNGRFHFGEVNRQLDEREAFVIILDKYDARRRRGNADHRAAVEYLYDVANKSQVLSELPEFKQIFIECINELDAALSPKAEHEKLAA